MTRTTKTLKEEHANAAEATAFREALQIFSETLVKNLSPNEAEREDILTKLANTTHLHQSIVLFKSSIIENKPRGVKMHVLIKFEGVEDVNLDPRLNPS